MSAPPPAGTPWPTQRGATARCGQCAATTASCRDYWSKYELGWHVSPTANQHDAITAMADGLPLPGAIAHGGKIVR